MTPDEIRAIVKTITYKPGHTIDVRFRNSDGLGRQFQRYEWAELRVSAELCDAVPETSPDEPTVPVTFSQTFPPDFMDSKERVILAVEDVIRRFERHEFDEWFRVDGVPVYNPHPGPTFPTSVNMAMKP